MPKLQNVKKVLVIGSGPIIIGQAAEFDYSGTQACRALKEEGLEVVLVNSNPATIMTDVHIADRVYVEPVNVEFLESVIKRERPDALLATALNVRKTANCLRKRWKKSTSRFRKARLLKPFPQLRNLRVKLVIRLLYARHILWAAPAAALPTTTKNLTIL